MKIAGPPLFLALSLAACAPLPPASPGPQVRGDGLCHADRVAWAIGQTATEARMAQIWRESGAGLLRALGPHQPATRDYRADRVNVRLDDDNRIRAVDCG